MRTNFSSDRLDFFSWISYYTVYRQSLVDSTTESPNSVSSVSRNFIWTKYSKILLNRSSPQPATVILCFIFVVNQRHKLLSYTLTQRLCRRIDHQLQHADNHQISFICCVICTYIPICNIADVLATVRTTARAHIHPRIDASMVTCEREKETLVRATTPHRYQCVDWFVLTRVH